LVDFVRFLGTVSRLLSLFPRARGSMARINSVGHSRHQPPFRRSGLDTLFHLDDHQS